MSVNSAWWKSHCSAGNHDNKCEQCDTDMGEPEGVIEGDLGFYCSEECLEETEISDEMSESALRKAERQQMGIV